MIARLWRCIAAAEKVPDYMAHFEQAVLPEIKQIEGFQQAYILRRTLEDDGVELTVVTMWESFDAIRAFAGDNIERAVVAPEAQAVLRSFDPTVTHYEVAMNAAPTL